MDLARTQRGLARLQRAILLALTSALLALSCASEPPPERLSPKEASSLSFLDRLRAAAEGKLPPDSIRAVDPVEVPENASPVFDAAGREEDAARGDAPSSDRSLRSPGEASEKASDTGDEASPGADAAAPTESTTVSPLESSVANAELDLEGNEEEEPELDEESSAIADPPPARGATREPRGRSGPPVGQRLARLEDFRPARPRTLAESNAAAGPMTVDIDGSLLVAGHPFRPLVQRYSAEELKPIGAPFDFTRGVFAEFDAADRLGTRQQLADICVFKDAEGKVWDVTVLWAYYNARNESYEKVHCRRREDGRVVSALPATEVRGRMGAQVFGGGVAVVPPRYQERFGGRELVCGWSVTQQTVSSSNGPSCILFSPRLLIEVRSGAPLAFDDAPVQFHPQKRAHPSWSRASSLRDRFWIDTPELRAYVVVGAVGRSGETYYKRLPDGTKVSGGYFDVEGYEGVFIITDPLELEQDATDGRPVWRLRTTETWYRTGELLPPTLQPEPAGQHATIAGCAHDPERRIVYLLRPRWDADGAPLIMPLRY